MLAAWQVGVELFAYHYDGILPWLKTVQSTNYKHSKMGILMLHELELYIKVLIKEEEIYAKWGPQDSHALGESKMVFSVIKCPNANIQTKQYRLL